MGRLPRLLLTVFERTGVVGHQSPARDYRTYCDLATDRKQRANDIVRKHHSLNGSRVNRGNSALAVAIVGFEESQLRLMILLVEPGFS